MNSSRAKSPIHHVTHLNNVLHKTVLHILSGNNCYLYKSLLSSLLYAKFIGTLTLVSIREQNHEFL